MLIHEAIEFAAVRHRNQVRKGTDAPLRYVSGTENDRAKNV